MQDASEKAFEEFILFQVKGQHATVHNSKEKREGKTTENVVHRTYSTKLGTLILYSDSLYLKEKKRKKLVKKEIKSSIEDVTFEGTVEDLTAYILRFGNVCVIFDNIQLPMLYLLYGHKDTSTQTCGIQSSKRIISRFISFILLYCR